MQFGGIEAIALKRKLERAAMQKAVKNWLGQAPLAHELFVAVLFTIVAQMISEASVKGYFRWECSIFLSVVKVLNKIIQNRRDILNLLPIKAMLRLNIIMEFVLSMVKVLNIIFQNRRDILNLLPIKAMPRLNIAVHFVDIMAPVLQGIAWKQPNISSWRQRKKIHVHRFSSAFFIVVAWDVVLLLRRQRNASSWQQTREIVMVNSTVRFAASAMSSHKKISWTLRDISDIRHIKNLDQGK
jgi:hypothetical protein